MIDRRSFLALLAGAPLAVEALVSGQESAECQHPAPQQLGLPLLEIEGSYHQIGYRIGRCFGGRIREIIARRADWHAGLLRRLGSRAGRRRSRQLLRLTRRHFPQYLDELRGTAEGAGLAFDAVWAMTIKSELAALEPETPGCSTLLLRSPDRSRAWLCHNEDGHAAYLDQMFVVRVTPPSGVRFVAMVYPGILTGNAPALNSEGVVQTTNYIGGTCSEVGLPRYVIGRAILEARSAAEARQIATMSPRAYPYHHNIGGCPNGTYYSVETVPGRAAVQQPQGLWVHTNHLLHAGTRGWEHEDGAYRDGSSMSRYEVLTAAVQAADTAALEPENLVAMLSSHQQRPYSPCRHPEGDIKGQTLGTALFDLRSGRFRLYRGNPCTALPAGAYADLEP